MRGINRNMGRAKSSRGCAEF